MRTLTTILCSFMAACLILPASAQLLRRNRPVVQEASACANGMCEAQQSVQTSVSYSPPVQMQSQGELVATAGCTGGQMSYRPQRQRAFLAPTVAYRATMVPVQAVFPVQAFQAAPVVAAKPAVAAPAPPPKAEEKPAIKMPAGDGPTTVLAPLYFAEPAAPVFLAAPAPRLGFFRRLLPRFRYR